MERDAEIERIHGELAILQARYALYRRTASIMRGFFITLVPILVLVLLTFAVKLFLFDTLYGLFFVGALLVSLLILNWYIKSADLRWIDIACPSPGPFDPHFFYPDAYGDVHPRSDAELLEWQIADRQRRLSAMGEPMQ